MPPHFVHHQRFPRRVHPNSVWQLLCQRHGEFFFFLFYNWTVFFTPYYFIKTYSDFICFLIYCSLCNRPPAASVVIFSPSLPPSLSLFIFFLGWWSTYQPWTLGYRRSGGLRPFETFVIPPDWCVFDLLRHHFTYIVLQHPNQVVPRN